MKYRICNKCNWVAFSLTRKEAQDEVDTFKVYFDTLSKEEQNFYYGISLYEKCFLCGGSHKDFREALDSEVPFGSTISPIIFEEN